MLNGEKTDLGISNAIATIRQSKKVVYDRGECLKFLRVLSYYDARKELDRKDHIKSLEAVC